MWYSFFQEKRIALTRLLDICLAHFSNNDNVGSNPTPSENGKGGPNFFTTNTCIGKWLIHHFIIDLDRAYSQCKNYNSEFELLNDYFVNDLGLKT